MHVFFVFVFVFSYSLLSPAHPTSMLGIDPKTSCMLSKYCSTELYLSPSLPLLIYSFVYATEMCVYYACALVFQWLTLLSCLFQVLCNECVLLQLFIGSTDFCLGWEVCCIIFCVHYWLLISSWLWFCFATWHNQK